MKNAVKLTYKDLFTVIEPFHSPDLLSLNVAIRVALEKHNNKNLDRRNYSHRSYFEDVEHYIRRVLEKTRYQNQADKMCSGILNFARKAGSERLAAACLLTDSYGKYSFREIQDILQNKSEATDLPEELADMPEH